MQPPRRPSSGSHHGSGTATPGTPGTPATPTTAPPELRDDDQRAQAPTPVRDRESPQLSFRLPHWVSPSVRRSLAGGSRPRSQSQPALSGQRASPDQPSPAPRRLVIPSPAHAGTISRLPSRRGLRIDTDSPLREEHFRTRHTPTRDDTPPNGSPMPQPSEVTPPGVLVRRQYLEPADARAELGAMLRNGSRAHLRITYPDDHREAAVHHPMDEHPIASTACVVMLRELLVVAASALAASALRAQLLSLMDVPDPHEAARRATQITVAVGLVAVALACASGARSAALVAACLHEREAQGWLPRVLQAFPLACLATGAVASNALAGPHGAAKAVVRSSARQAYCLLRDGMTQGFNRLSRLKRDSLYPGHNLQVLGPLDEPVPRESPYFHEYETRRLAMVTALYVFITVGCAVSAPSIEKRLSPTDSERGFAQRAASEIAPAITLTIQEVLDVVAGALATLWAAHTTRMPMPASPRRGAGGQAVATQDTVPLRLALSGRPPATTRPLHTSVLDHAFMRSFMAAPADAVAALQDTLNLAFPRHTPQHELVRTLPRVFQGICTALTEPRGFVAVYGRDMAERDERSLAAITADLCEAASTLAGARRAAQAREREAGPAPTRPAPRQARAAPPSLAPVRFHIPDDPEGLFWWREALQRVELRLAELAGERQLRQSQWRALATRRAELLARAVEPAGGRAIGEAAAGGRPATPDAAPGAAPPRAESKARPVRLARGHDAPVARALSRAACEAVVARGLPVSLVGAQPEVHALLLHLRLVAQAYEPGDDMLLCRADADPAGLTPPLPGRLGPAPADAKAAAPAGGSEAVFFRIARSQLCLNPLAGDPGATS